MENSKKTKKHGVDFLKKTIPLDRTELRKWVDQLFERLPENELNKEEVEEQLAMFSTALIIKKIELISRGKAASLADVPLCRQNKFMREHNLNP